MSLYRICGYLALIAVPIALVAFSLGHPLDGLTAHLTQGAGQ